jgi:hypothetical protein
LATVFFFCTAFFFAADFFLAGTLQPPEVVATPMRSLVIKQDDGEHHQQHLMIYNLIPFSVKTRTGQRS